MKNILSHFKGAHALPAFVALGLLLLDSAASVHAQGGGRPRPIPRDTIKIPSPVVIGKPVDKEPSSSPIDIGKPVGNELPPSPIILGLTPKAEVDFVREALDYSRLGKLASNTSAAVYATVVIQTGNSMNVANGTNLIYAFGRVTPVGSAPGDSLSGSLPVSLLSPTSGNPMPTLQKVNQTIDISVDAKGRTTFLWKLAGKPFLGRPAGKVNLSANSKFLFGDLPYVGGGTRVSVRLSHSIFPLEIEEPPPAPKPAPAAQPKGMRLRLDSVVKTTNSEDGVNDNSCEMYGNISLGGQMFWDNAPTSTQPNFTHPGKPVFYNIYFDKPESFLLLLAGTLKDEDEWSSDDTMWGAAGTQVNLKTLFESPSKSMTIGGDHNSESADLILTVSKVSDLY